MVTHTVFPVFFFFNDTATTEIYTLSLHDALPICFVLEAVARVDVGDTARLPGGAVHQDGVDGRVGPQLKIFSAPQLWDENVQAAVPGPYVAAPVAGSAIVTGRAAIVEPAQHSQRFWHHLDAQLCGAFPDQHFAAPRVEGGEQAFARRRVVNPFGTSGNKIGRASCRERV